MTGSMDPLVLTRTYAAPPEVVWELLSTAEGVESWWAPDGFEVAVDEFDLRPAGRVLYSMTAVAPEQVAFVRGLGLPLTNEFRRTFVDVAPQRRLAYLSLIDFIPGQDPYEHLTVIELRGADAGTDLVMTIEPMHDQGWTEEYGAHRAVELENLAAVIRRERAREPRARASA